MARLGVDRRLRTVGHGRLAPRPVNVRARRRMPRLRWAVRHPLDVLERSGFGPVQAAGILLFLAVVVGWLTYLYFRHLL